MSINVSNNKRVIVQFRTNYSTMKCMYMLRTNKMFCLPRVASWKTNTSVSILLVSTLGLILRKAGLTTNCKMVFSIATCTRFVKCKTFSRRVKTIASIAPVAWISVVCPVSRIVGGRSRRTCLVTTMVSATVCLRMKRRRLRIGDGDADLCWRCVDDDRTADWSIRAES